jgi:mycothiol synthase
MPVELLKGFRIRAPTPDDLETLTDLMNVTSAAEGLTPDETVADLREYFQRPGFHLATDAWLVEADDGRVVGFEGAWTERDETQLVFEADGYMHPEYTGQGIGTHLVRRMEAWARERAAEVLAGIPVCVRAGMGVNNKAAHRLFEAEGYTLVRHFWRMGIELDAAPPAPEWPEGVSVRTFVPGQDDHALHEAVEEAFQDHWGHVTMPFEKWAPGRIWSESFDPSLCFVAVEGDTIAGAARCEDRAEGGWVNTLAVRRPWRQRGLGMALLRQAFGEFYRRGKRKVALGVDAYNPTGATRLYERAGMRMVEGYALYEKALRS